MNKVSKLAVSLLLGSLLVPMTAVAEEEGDGWIKTKDINVIKNDDGSKTYEVNRTITNPDGETRSMDRTGTMHTKKGENGVKRKWDVETTFTGEEGGTATTTASGKFQRKNGHARWNLDRAGVDGQGREADRKSKGQMHKAQDGSGEWFYQKNVKGTKRNGESYNEWKAGKDKPNKRRVKAAALGSPTGNEKFRNTRKKYRKLP